VVLGAVKVECGKDELENRGKIWCGLMEEGFFLVMTCLPARHGAKRGLVLIFQFTLIYFCEVFTPELKNW
jgi:hypothetical protein